MDKPTSLGSPLSLQAGELRGATAVAGIKVKPTYLADPADVKIRRPERVVGVQVPSVHQKPARTKTHALKEFYTGVAGPLFNAACPWEDAINTQTHPIKRPPARPPSI
jgi:hypothetical protein